MLHGHEAPQRRLVEKQKTKPVNMNFIHLLLLCKNNITTPLESVGQTQPMFYIFVVNHIIKFRPWQVQDSRNQNKTLQI